VTTPFREDPFVQEVKRLTQSSSGAPLFKPNGGALTIHGIPFLLSAQGLQQLLGAPIGTATTAGAATTVRYDLKTNEETLISGEPTILFFASLPSLGVRITSGMATYLEGRTLEQSGRILAKPGDSLEEVVKSLGPCRGAFFLHECAVVIPGFPPSFGSPHEDWRAVYYQLYFEPEDPVIYQTWPEGQRSWRTPSRNMTVCLFFAEGSFFGVTMSSLDF
jgi:hypothetical protein